MTHPDILSAERFGSRWEYDEVICPECGEVVDVNYSDYVVEDGYGRAFCNRRCYCRYYQHDFIDDFEEGEDWDD